MSVRLPLFTTHFAWDAWDAVIATQGLTIDRPYRTAHPRYPDIIYPLDYGYINGTRSTDGEGVDVFVGTAEGGLVGLIVADYYQGPSRGQAEVKLLYRCTPKEIYLAHGFINFAPHLMSGRLALRHPMPHLWANTPP